MKFRWQRFGIPVSNFPAFYEHNGERSNPGGVTPHNGIYGGASNRGIFFRH